MARGQLLALGMSAGAIRHRLRTGRLRPLLRGVYAVGRRDVPIRGRWMAAVLVCGAGARLSHRSAAALWGLRGELPVAGRRPGPIEVAVPSGFARRHPGVVIHRQRGLEARPVREVDGIPATDPASTFVDLATCVSTAELRKAINEADHRGLINPEGLLAALDSQLPRPGIRALRALLEPGFRRVDSGLEERFLEIVAAAGLPLPETQVQLGRNRVDFYWPELGLVVEADSLRYHRTHLHQTSDQRRDQDHLRAGLTPLHFSEDQIRHDPAYVRRTLTEVMARLHPAIR